MLQEGKRGESKRARGKRGGCCSLLMVHALALLPSCPLALLPSCPLALLPSSLSSSLPAVSRSPPPPLHTSYKPEHGQQHDGEVVEEEELDADDMFAQVWEVEGGRTGGRERASGREGGREGGSANGCCGAMS
jgi:hypothetical protein